MRYLIVDGYPEAARQELQTAGASSGGQLFERMLRRRAPQAESLICYPSDDESPWTSERLAGFSGVLWTGCSLCVHQQGDPRVERQVALCQAAFEAGIPQFGSCWAVQVAAVAAGGRVAANPRGREMGLARKIALTPEGRAHPMYRGKPSVFEAFICHLDEVVEIPEGGTLLASNSFTHVQALEVRYLQGTFWGLQYHPEYTVGEMARLAHARRPALVREGFFPDLAAADHYVARLEALQSDPQRRDLRWELAIDDDVLDEDVRQCELINWLSLTRP